jgi:anti-sigma factor ChrR (cupin superfamily)
MCNPNGDKGVELPVVAIPVNRLLIPSVRVQGPVWSKLPSVDRQLCSGSHRWQPAGVMTLTVMKQPLATAAG